MLKVCVTSLLTTVAVLIGIGCLIVSCVEPVQDVWTSHQTIQLSDVPGLEDCKFIQFDNPKYGGYYTVIRCPNSNVGTTYYSGKYGQTTNTLTY